MWLLFDGPKLTAYSKGSGTPPPGAVVLTLSRHKAEALYRACEAGRVTYFGGVLVDGATWVSAADESSITYTQAISAINASALPAGLKAWMRLVTEHLLEEGTVEL